jgi:Bacterial Ig-like domain/Calx-beta domain
MRFLPASGRRFWHMVIETQTPRRSKHAASHCFVPRLATLEERVVPATITWTNMNGGSWATASNWNPAQVPGIDDDAVIPALNSGASVAHSSGTDTVHGLVLANNFNLSGGSLTISNSGSFTKSTLTVAAGATLNFTSGAVVNAAEASYTTFGIVVNGTMNATATTFTRSSVNGYSGSSDFQINAGGRLTATGSSFNWSGLSLANGALLNSTDITGNVFNQTITIPAIDATLLANNQSFRDIEIQPGSLTSGQTATFDPLGTVTTANQRYVFTKATGTLTVSAGATLNITNGAVVRADEGSYTTFGIVVNGTMNATGANFTRASINGYSGSSAIQVNAGGRLTATGSTFAWSGLSLANGSLLNSTDITGNIFNQDITIPAADATLLANNQSFQDVNLQPGTVGSGQTVTLSPLGTVTTANQRYIFTATTSNFTVAAGGALNITSGAVVIGAESSYTTFGIVVNGNLNINGATFTRASINGYSGSSAIQVNAGGHLIATNNTFAWSSLALANGSILVGTDITGNIFNQPITIPAADATLLANNQTFQDVNIQPGTISAGQSVTLNPLGTVTTVNQRYIFTATTGNFTVQAGAGLFITSGAVVTGAESSYTTFGIVVNGLLNITGATFNRASINGYSGSSAIQVNAGGRLIATNNTFAWSSLSLANGSILGGSDITGNIFNQNITIPAADATLLANNQTFQDVYIQPGTLTNGQNVTLAPLGTITTVNQRYIFTATTANFNVQAGATLNIASGAVVNAAESSYTTFGLVVNGTLHVDTANFTRTSINGYSGSSAIQIGAGGRLIAANSTFAWSGLSLANGSILNSGDITGNTFNQTITIPAIDATLFANNQTFHDVQIQPGSLTSGQVATLAPLGTITTVNQRYVFTAATGNFTVQSGAILNVIGGAVVNAAESSSTPFGIIVNGIMNVGDSTSFTRSSINGYSGSSVIQVNSGGHFTATNSALGWSNVNLNAGSTDEFQFLTLANKVTINSGATINIASNNLSAIGNNGIIAVGTPSATIDLTNNYWGTTTPSEIAAKILDHVDDTARPTVLYDPYLNDPPVAFFDPISLPAATVGASYSQTMTPVVGTGPASNFAITAGALPAGLTLSSAGVLSGTPTAAGSFTFTISADDVNFGGPFMARQLGWLVVNAPVISFTPLTLPPARAGVSYSQSLSASGGTAPYGQFVITAGALPAGLTLSTSGTISGIPTASDGNFDFTVTAQDSSTGLNAPYTGSQNFTVMVDNSAPTGGSVNDGPSGDIDFQASATAIAANWAGFSDSGSGIASYQWAIGTSPGGTDVQEFTDVGNVTSALATGLSLSDGIPYFVSVTATDTVGNVSSPASSDGVSIDSTPPTPGIVNDSLGADIDTQLSATTITCNWSGFSDNSGNIASYQWAIGTSPGASDVRPFIAVGNVTSATASGLLLVRGAPYYTSVRAVDSVGNVGAAASSDGVTVVTPPPVITGSSVDSGVVGDGITNDNTPTLSGTAEPMTTIQVYRDGVLLGPTSSDVGGNWQFTVATVSDGLHHFTATETDPGNHVSAQSDPMAITVDATAPTVTINQDVGQADPTKMSPITFQVTFGEAVSGFDANDVSFAGSTVGGTLVANVTGSGADYLVSVAGMSGEGAVVASIVANAITDDAGNGNAVSTSTDNTVIYDNQAPSVTIDQDPGQVDPTFSGPIVFKITFSEPVTGFDESDVDITASTVEGTLVKSVSGSGADYLLSITGMYGAGDVIASIAAGAAVDALNNLSTASTSTDNRVYFNHVGTLQFSAPNYDGVEGGFASITVLRVNGGDGDITVHYATSSGTATTNADFDDTFNTLSWIGGNSDPQTILVPIVDDAPLNEGAEDFTLTLSSPTGDAVLGAQSTTKVTIAKSNGSTIDATDKLPQATFVDSDGDLVTLKLSGKVGSLTYYLTNGKGPISEIELTGTDSTKSVVSISVKKPKGGTGDGRVGVGAIDGTGVKTLSLGKADLTGTGINLTSFLGSLTIGDIAAGTGVTLTGAPPKVGQGTKIVAGVIGDATAIAITGAPLASLTATTIGTGNISAPSVGSITIKGKAKTKTASAIPGDFKANLTIDGTNLAAKAPALKSLKVAGSVSNSLIKVAGDVGSVSVGSFADSRLFAGYSGADDGSDPFDLTSTIGSFNVTAKGLAFARSYVIASNFKNVTLTSADPVNGGKKFGFFYNGILSSLSVKSQGFKFNPKGPLVQNPFGNFFVEKV